MITADVRLLDSAGLMIDESPITGESIPVSKDHTVELAPETPVHDLVNTALAGTTVVRGSGKGIVTGTGKATYLASIASRVTEKSPDTPLTRAMQAFSRRYIVLIVFLLALVGVVNYLSGGSPAQIAYVLVAQLVSSAPEGLPLVVTLVMIIGAIALSRKKTLTRYLPAVETLGSATILASDKTGTITEGRPEVKDTFPANEERLKMVAALCNDSRDGYGDPIDVSLARWVGEEFPELRRRYPLRKAYPFDTALKFMATVHDVEGRPTVFIKGAYESLKPLATNTDTGPLEKALDSMAEDGLRVLALGIGPFTGESPDRWEIEIIGLVGFLDPPKEGVREAVQTAQKAGIRVMMITGDYPATARRIAEDVGIFRPGDRTLAGPEVEGMSDGELGAALGNVTVLARILPEHKYRVVRVLQERGEVVAVTGDGVNDVPALKAADLGIAMGSGTEAAKSVAKMIILDNNLMVIVDAIRNGRIIALNLRKVIYYLVSTSLGELILISTSILMGMPLPLLPIQILWINLVTDGVQDKTFAFAREEGNVMDHPPADVSRQFFDLPQILRILYFGVTMGVINLVLFNYLSDIYPYQTVVSIVFVSVVFIQWFNGIQAQKEHAPFFLNVRESLRVNPYIFLGVALGILLQLTVIYLTPAWFRVTPLTPAHWFYVLAASISGFFMVEIRKWMEYLASGGGKPALGRTAR